MFLKKLEYRFLVQNTRNETATFPNKKFPFRNIPPKKPMLTQIEWEVQNGPIKRNGF